MTQADKQKLLARFKKVLDTVNPDDMSPEGMILAGMALLLRTQSGKFPKGFSSWSQDVVDFHEKFKINYSGGVRHLPPQLFSFRLARSLEEHKEYNASFDEPNLAHALDALIDHIYILLGTAHMHGFTPEILQEAWNRVHEANMAKELCSPENPGKYGKLGDKLDIVKPPGWKAPTFDDLLQ